MKTQEDQSWNLKSLFEVWAAACIGIANGKQVARRAGLLDELFSYDAVVDRWIDILREDSKAEPLSTKKLAGAATVNERLLTRVAKDGFNGALRSGGHASLADELGELLFDADMLEQLQLDVFSSKPPSRHWASHMLAAGRLPEFRVFDLVQRKQLRHCSEVADNAPRSKIEARILEGRLSVAIFGLECCRGRSTSCALLPFGFDEVFSRERKLDSVSPAMKRNGRKGVSLKAWKHLLVRTNGEKLCVQQCHVTKRGTVTCRFAGVTDPVEIAKRVLVVAVQH